MEGILDSGVVTLTLIETSGGEGELGNGMLDGVAFNRTIRPVATLESRKKTYRPSREFKRLRLSNFEELMLIPLAVLTLLGILLRMLNDGICDNRPSELW
jgi:hypothetical protein